MSKGAPTMTMSAAASLESSSKQVGLYGRWVKVVRPRYFEPLEISTSACFHRFALYCSCCVSCMENGCDLEARHSLRRIAMAESTATILFAITEMQRVLEVRINYS